MNATPQDEAAQLLGQVRHDLSSSTPDLKVALRRCQDACGLVGWSDWQLWCQHELNGYPVDMPVPWYRVALGRLTWKGGDFGSALARQLEGDTDDEDAPTIQQEFRWGVDFLRAVQQPGWWDEPTGEVRERYDRFRRRHYEVKGVYFFPVTAFTAILQQIEQHTFDFASQSYRVLRYGNALTDIWIAYRFQVDTALQHLGLTNHLEAVQVGLRSDNPEEWRNAVFGCRNILEDVAACLWLDPRPTYDHLPDPEGGKMKVGKQRFANRLHAYIHQKGVSTKQRKFVKAEVERLATSIRSLKDLEGRAHIPVTRDEARTIALATYFILGELALKTDLQPVETYGSPATPADDDSQY